MIAIEPTRVLRPSRGVGQGRTLFDSYDFKTRIMPVLVAAAPLALLLALAVADIWRHLAGVIALGGMVAVALAVAYALMQAVGDKGAAVEQRLWKEWDGPPATHPLRRRDIAFDSIHTKAAYAALRPLGQDLAPPSEDEESQTPAAADASHAHGAKRLGTNPQDRGRYKLVRAANAAYEFQRNALGIRSFGLTTSLTAVAGSIVATVISWPLSKPEWLFPAVGLFAAFCAAWWWTRGSGSMHRAADVYARRLIEGREEM